MPRRKFRPAPFEARTGHIEQVEFGRASVLVNGMIGEKPRSRVQLQQSLAIPRPQAAENDLYALNSLQLQRGRPLEQLTVQIPIEYLHDNLPPGTRDKIGIPMCGAPYVFNCEEQHVMRRIRKVYRRWREFWDVFRASEYIFWPIEAERGYFVTAVFHMKKGLMDDPDFDPDEDPHADIPQVNNPQFHIVEGWSVVDPQRGDVARRRVVRVKDRIERIFAIEGIIFGPDCYKDEESDNNERRPLPWVPPPSDGDNWSSGIRSFALVQQLMQRVLDFYCSEMEHTERFFVVPTCGWLNVDQVRHEMMGICAVNALEDMNWNARIAIECIEEITEMEEIFPEGFPAALLEPNDRDKHAYVPASDVGGFPRRVA